MTDPIAVLYVEDGATDASAVSADLTAERDRLRVTSRDSVASARATLARAEFDCAVVGPALANADGGVGAALEAICDSPAPVVVLTDDADQVREALSAGATDVVTWRGTSADIAVLAHRIVRLVDGSERRQHLRTVVDNVPLFLYAFDADGVFTMGTGKGLEPLGIAPGQFDGQSAFDVFAHVPEAVETVSGVLAGEIDHSVNELYGRTLETWFNPIRDADGDVESVVAVSLDVTDQHAYERAFAGCNVLVDSDGKIVVVPSEK